MNVMSSLERENMVDQIIQDMINEENRENEPDREAVEV